MKALRKSIIACGVSMLLCLGLLIGTTFAWFTDSITNSGNTITAGTLSIEAYAYKTDAETPSTSDTGMTVTIGTSDNGVNRGEQFSFSNVQIDLGGYSKIIYNTNDLWEPGKSSARLLQVQNTGSLAAKVSFEFATDGNLVNAMWYDLIEVEANGNALTMKEGEYFDRLDMVTLSDSQFEYDFPVDPTPRYFIFVYGVKEEAGNEYQGASFYVDISVLATQATAEEDGFGNQDYDEDAEYLYQGAAIAGVLERGGTLNIEAGKSYLLDRAVTMSNGDYATMNLATDSIMNISTEGQIKLSGDAQLIINGDGSLVQDYSSVDGRLFNTQGNSKIVINGGTYVAGLVCILAEDNSQVEIQGGHFEALEMDYGVYWLLNIQDEDRATASITVYGGTFVNFDPSNCTTEGENTNFVAEGYKVVADQHGEDIWYTVVPE